MPLTIQLMNPAKSQKEFLSHCSQILNRMGEQPLEEDQKIMQQAQAQNSWFTEENIRKASRNWGQSLRAEAIDQWIQELSIPSSSKTIALILAGNIPWVGLHDLLSVLVSGHRALVKCASDDMHLLPYLVEQLPENYRNQVEFTKDRIQNFDAVIATGSNNSARYFEAYFQKYPHIIRKNRNAVAILNGNETLVELEALGRDLLDYFGRGCRNVTHIFVPKGFDLNQIFGGVFPLSEIIHHHSYANNYDYYKALYLMNEVPFLENGFFLLKEDKTINSPLATAHYSYYESLEKLHQLLENQKERIQCVVGEPCPGLPSFPLGAGQSPELWDYADGVNTLDFLQKL